MVIARTFPWKEFTVYVVNEEGIKVQLVKPTRTPAGHHSLIRLEMPEMLRKLLYCTPGNVHFVESYWSPPSVGKTKYVMYFKPMVI